MAEVALRALGRILKGETAATSVLFPNSSSALVEQLYQTNLVANYFNEALAESLIDYVREVRRQDGQRRLRILEVGAGTGGTTNVVVKALEPYTDAIQEYCFTDLSRAFLLDARERWPGAPWLSFARFDAEASPDAQGIESGQFDVVIAANVLHATKDIRCTLANVKATLKRNGLLLLYEVTDRSLFAHMTFGLLKGWWLYEDAELAHSGIAGAERARLAQGAAR